MIKQRDSLVSRQNSTFSESYGVSHLRRPSLLIAVAPCVTHSSPLQLRPDEVCGVVSMLIQPWQYAEDASDFNIVLLERDKRAICAVSYLSPPSLPPPSLSVLSL